jgi:hypothetical protein
MSTHDWLVLSGGIKQFAAGSVVPLFATAFSILQLRLISDARTITAFLVMGFVTLIYFAIGLDVAAEELRSTASMHPENYGGYVAVFGTSTLCMVLFLRAWWRRSRQRTPRGFEVITASRVTSGTSGAAADSIASAAHTRENHHP